jgi:hypothetical protein
VGSRPGDLETNGLLLRVDPTGTAGAEATTAEAAHRRKARHRKPARDRIETSRPVRERVLYRQTRGARFTMYTFRSMVPGAEQRLHDVLELDAGAGVLFKAHDDPRIRQ